MSTRGRNGSFILIAKLEGISIEKVKERTMKNAVPSLLFSHEVPCPPRPQTIWVIQTLDIEEAKDNTYPW